MSGRPWRAQAERVASVCGAQAGLIGGYVHGSAALGGLGPASDLDVLVGVDGSGDWEALGSRLLAEGGQPCPLELSVVSAGACAKPSAPWPYVLHVNSAASRVCLDAGEGDPDLAAHYAVTRAAGVAIIGPLPQDVIGSVPRGELLDHLRRELRWGMENADQRYAVLNACRAAAYSFDGVLLSKPDGARWWLHRYGDMALVEAAAAAQREGRDLGECSHAARSFVVEVIDRL